MANESIRALYPFLNGRDEPTVDERTPIDAALVDSVLEKARHGREVSQAFFDEHAAALIGAARALSRVFANGAKVLCMGNGGSSCDAAHFAVEFLHPITAGRPALPVHNLTMDTATLSAIGNDLGMRHVFRRQLEAHARPNDGLLGFSTSGNSDNLMAAYQKAKELGLVTLGLAGGDGGEMKASGLVDHCLVVGTDSVHRVQEVHVAAYHILWDLTHTLLAESRGPALPRGPGLSSGSASSSGPGLSPGDAAQRSGRQRGRP
jgi:D-sedoheptulose 7-phosphate isomerase